jgi:hypothetical protein
VSGSDVTANQEDASTYWAVVANVVAERPHGPGGAVTRSGTKHFRAGAKVHVIDWYPGMCDNVVVVAQHRKSRKFITAVLRAAWIENLRVSVVYSPTVIQKIEERKAKAGYRFSRKQAEEVAKALPCWR